MFFSSLATSSNNGVIGFETEIGNTTCQTDLNGSVQMPPLTTADLQDLEHDRFAAQAAWTANITGCPASITTAKLRVIFSSGASIRHVNLGSTTFRGGWVTLQKDQGSSSGNEIRVNEQLTTSLRGGAGSFTIYPTLRRNRAGSSGGQVMAGSWSVPIALSMTYE